MEDTDWEEAMGGVAKDVLVTGVQGGGPLPDHLHSAKPGLQSCLHVLVTPLLYWSPLSSACTTSLLIL